MCTVVFAALSGLIPVDIGFAQELRRFDLAMKDGEVAPQWRTIRIKQGDSVELHWSSQRPVRLHLHGYDLELAVEPGQPAVMAFKAVEAGRFALSTVREEGRRGRAHQHGGRVLYLEIYP
jgi:hypothetical protein